MSDLTDAIVDAALARLKPWTDSQYGDLFAIAAERAVRIVLMEAESVYRSDERAKVSEEIAADILTRLAAIGLRPTPWADGYTLASRYAAAVSRKHAANGPQIDAAGREGACTSDSTQDGPNAAETRSGRSGEGSQT